jgi:hypothetical protein
MLHSGAKRIAEEKLDIFPAPPATESYAPVSHYELVNLLRETLAKHGVSVTTTEFGIQKGKVNGETDKGARLFGLFRTNVNEGESGDALSLCYGLRNSYDKTMSVGFVAGSGVFVCDNLSITGEISVIHKHTPGVWDFIVPMVDSVAIVATKQHEVDKGMKQAMKDKPIDIVSGLDILGSMAARGKLNFIGGANSQFGRAIKSWREPEHDEFKDRNFWSLYNACTHAVKRTTLNRIMTDNAAMTLYIKEKFFPKFAEETSRVTEEMVKIRNAARVR